MSQSEAEKLNHHLTLLRSEYVKIQQKCAVLERENEILSAQSSSNRGKDGFVSKLLATVGSLYNKPLYSDLTIKTPDSQIYAHKFVLSARSDKWRVASLSEADSLDWTDLDEDVSLTLLNWVYTDQVTFTSGDKFSLDLMAAASQFDLSHLVDKCEQNLVSSVSPSNCVRFYATAHRIQAERLKEHCSLLISANWDSFTAEDFAELAPELVYDMLKTRANYPLHSAIKLRREDVVFLYLIENSVDLMDRIHQADDKGRLPLDMALADGQYGIAKSLVEHQVNVNQMSTSGGGLSLLHLALEREDPKACMFLLSHGAQANLQTTVDRNAALHLIATKELEAVAEPGENGTDVNLLEVFKALLSTHGADINLQNVHGDTPLHVAVQTNNMAVFQILVKAKGINLELVNVEGKPPLWLALIQDNDISKQGVSAMSQELVIAGADVNCVCSPAGDTLLHAMADLAREEAAVFLVSSGASVNKVNRRGESVLHLAASRGLVTCVTALLVAGADPNLQTGPFQAAANGFHLDHFDDSPDSANSSGKASPWRQTALHLALYAKQEAVVTCLLEFSKPNSDLCGLTSEILDINLRNSEDEYPLGLALTHGFAHLAEQMIESGADVNITYASGLTLLQKAIVEGEAKSALFLLAHGADINARTPQGMTPLELGIRHRLPVVVEKLCLAGADTLSSSSGDPPLWLALEAAFDDEQQDKQSESLVEIASILVRHGVDCDSWGEGPDGCQQTLLHRAIDENKVAAGCFLIRSGCDLNSPRRPGPGGRGGEEAVDGQPPIHLAAQWGQDDVVTCLLEHGADVNKQDAEGKTVLHHAIENGQQGIINLLLGYPGINLTARDKNGLSPFACAMTFKNNSAARVILELEPGAAEQHDSRGKNFLHTAIIKGDLESLLFLLSISVNVHSKTTDANKLAPLLLAVQTGNEMMVRNLLLAGANVQEKTLTGQTGLILAAELDYPEIASVLINNAVDFSAVDENGNNALHVAVREGNLRTAKILLTESRIDAEAFNNKGRSPFHVLAQFGEKSELELFELFLECMPEYPIDKPDSEGNTPLLLAYVKGSGELCRALVKRGAILGTMNKNMVNIFNHPVATKQLLFRLLDILSSEPKWGDGDNCEECQTKFGITTRKHHCRHCGRLLCGKCSSKEMPIIKYNLNKPVRVCEVCSDLLTLGVGAGI